MFIIKRNAAWAIGAEIEINEPTSKLVWTHWFCTIAFQKVMNQFLPSAGDK